MAVEFEQVAQILFDTGGVMFGEFTLASGIASPFYLDLRKIRSFPTEKRHVVDAYVSLIDGLQYDRLADVPTSITPVASSICDRLGISQITPRLDYKEHGTVAKIDGVYERGETIVVVDDLITNAGSKLKAIGILEEEGLVVKDVVVLIDRQQGGREQLESAGYQLHAYTNMLNLIEYYARVGIVGQDRVEQTLKYLGMK